MIRIFAFHAALSALLAAILTAHPGEVHKVIAAHLLVVFALQLLVSWLVFGGKYLSSKLLQQVASVTYATGIILQLIFWSLYASGNHFFGHPFTWWVFLGYVGEYRNLFMAMNWSPWLGDAAWGLMALLWALLIGVFSRHLHAPKKPFWRRWVMGGGTALGALLYGVWITPVYHAVSYYDEPTYAVFFSHPNKQLDDIGRAVAPDFETWQSYPRNQLQERPNVIVLVVDALRADYLPMYDAQKGIHTPFLDSLWRAGGWSKVDTAFSAAPASFGGITSLMASRTMSHITPNSFTLADALHLQGYQTHFYLSGNHTAFFGLNHYYGREQDFDAYVDAANAVGFKQNDDRIVTSKIAQLPSAEELHDPIYLHLHYNSVHEIGWLAEPYASRPVQATNPYMAHYERGLAQWDDALRKAWSALMRKGYLDDAVVVITADHGQLLGEGGLYGHGKSLNAEQLWIPMLYWTSKGSLSIEPTYGSSVDFAPTILHHLGLPQPDKWQGRALQERETLPRFTYHQGQRHYAIVYRDSTGWFKYNRDETQNPPQDALFDLRADFRQQVPIPALDQKKRRKILLDLRRKCTEYFELTEIPERNPLPSVAEIP